MKRIGLIDVDGKGTFPSIPLMKISAYHKSCGDLVDWYYPFNGKYDKVYLSKVFSFSQDYIDCIDADEIVRGGTGYSIRLVNGREVYDKSKDKDLPNDVEHIYPDYSLYAELTKDTAFGFLTRGCPRGCNFCVIKKKRELHRIKRLIYPSFIEDKRILYFVMQISLLAEIGKIYCNNL